MVDEQQRTESRAKEVFRENFIIVYPVAIQEL